MAKFIIKTPLPNFNGSQKGVHFRNGHGETQDAFTAGLFNDMGYEVTEEKVVVKKAPAKK